MDKKINELVEYIKQAKTITVLTGAGISTSSGIPDFRSTDGLYKKGMNREQVLSKSFYHRKPKVFWKEFKNIFQIKLFGNYQPNDGHMFLKKLEDMGKKVFILTQNVDGLHKKAGNNYVFELHGTIDKAICPKCQKEYSLDYVNSYDLPRCEVDDFILKPDVVLFGEQIRYIETAFGVAYDCDLFLSIGTSLQVYPVNTIPKNISGNKVMKKVIINREATELDHYFNLKFHTDINETLNKVGKLL